MKAINLLSLVNAKNDLSTSLFKLYQSNFGIDIKDNELDDIESLLSQLEDYTQEIDILDGFFIGYTINQISKEFDLLRFGKKKIINIELKRENTGERIREQLIKNKYYLSFLGKKILSFTYVVEEKKLFYLNNNEVLTECDFSFLISTLNNQVVENILDVNSLFDPSNYLVSPFNSTEDFMGERYFLTDHQETIKKNILKASRKTGACFLAIEGAAGTGKTLLTYDIAKDYIKRSKNVLIFHCGSLNEGHIKLCEEYLWSIAPIKDLRRYSLCDYDLIILDEVQRIYKTQFDQFISEIINTSAKCIFSYDSRQCLASWEIKSNIPQYIKQQVSPQMFKLTEKIRTNKEIAAFIKNLFDKNKRSPQQVYRNVDIQYFSKAYDARDYIDILKNQGWKVINYTPSRYYVYPYDRYQYRHEDNAHKVIGQEYDNVIAVIDKHFYYNEDGKLSTYGWSAKPYYHPTKMLFQIVTRTRKKLSIIIINNKSVLEQCLKIIHSK